MTLAHSGASIEVPECLDWYLERVLSHERNRASRYEVEAHWSLEDLARANLTLDLFDESERRASRDAEMARRMPKAR